MPYLELKIPPPVVAFTLVLIMYLTRDWLPDYGISQQLSWGIAGAVFSLGMSIGIISVLQFKRAKTTINPTVPQQTQAIVDDGLFSLSRNPMYLGLVICIASGGIAVQHLGVVGFVIVGLVYLQKFQIIPEEKILTEKFGEPYTEYCKRVARWL